MKNKFLIFILLLIFISPINALESLPAQKQGRSVILWQACDLSSYSNISSVKSGSTVLINKAVMIEITDDYYEYNFTNTSTLGTYVVSGYCDEDGEKSNWAYDFNITPDGKESTLVKGIIYFGLLSLIILLIVIIIYSFQLLPNGNNKDREGMIISINNLKYLRPVFFLIIYGLLLLLTFVSSNIAYLFLENNMMYKILFNIYTIMMWFAIPMLIIWIVYILANVFQDKETRSMIERGVRFGGEP